MEEKWTIYLHKNKINNKVYVGQTKCIDPNKRWRNGTHYKNTYFGRAIEKYGWDNFEHIILEKDLPSQNIANQREKYWINFYNSNNSNFGYNLTSGGQYYILNEKTKEKRSMLQKQRWENEEYRNNTITKLKKYWESHPEIKEKRGQKVKCIETNQIFNSYRQAGEWCGLKFYKNSFLAYFRGEKYSCGKHPKTQKPLHWVKIDKFGKEIINNQNFNIEKSKKGTNSTKKVKCTETNQIFNSLVEAANWCHLKNTSSITNMIKGRTKSAGKHPETQKPLHWEYIE